MYFLHHSTQQVTLIQFQCSTPCFHLRLAFMSAHLQLSLSSIFLEIVQTDCWIQTVQWFWRKATVCLQNEEMNWSKTSTRQPGRMWRSAFCPNKLRRQTEFNQILLLHNKMCTDKYCCLVVVILHILYVKSSRLQLLSSIPLKHGFLDPHCSEQNRKKSSKTDLNWAFILYRHS